MRVRVRARFRVRVRVRVRFRVRVRVAATAWPARGCSRMASPFMKRERAEAGARLSAQSATACRRKRNCIRPARSE